MIYVLSIDGLPACTLGCYGEQRYPTPNFDRIAAQSTVCNFYFANADLTSFNETTGIRQLHWTAPQLELDVLRAAAESWLDEETFDSIFEGEETGSPTAVIERLQAATTPEKVGLIEATAMTLSHDLALGEWLDGMTFSDEDLLIIVGRSGNPKRQAESRPDWLTAVSESVVHLPLMIHEPGLGEHERIEELVQTADVLALVEIASTENDNAVCDWREQLSSTPILWETPEVKAIRSQDWLLVEPRVETPDGEDPLPVKLFRKPDDCWDVLDLAPQFPGLTEEYERTGTLPEAEGLSY